jgi:hypothetical protein
MKFRKTALSKYRLILYIILALPVLFTAQSADAHALTVWGVRNMRPALTAAPGKTLEVWATFPDPFLTPRQAAQDVLNADGTGELALRKYLSNGDWSPIFLEGYFSPTYPELGVIPVGDPILQTAGYIDDKKLWTSVGRVEIDEDHAGTVVLASLFKSSGASTIRHFSKCFVNAKNDGTITQLFAPKMRDPNGDDARLEIVPLDDADKFKTGETVRFRIFLGEAPIMGDELKDLVAGMEKDSMPAELAMGFAYPDGEPSGEEESLEFDFAGEDASDIAQVDYETGIFSITFDRAGVWGMEVYKPRVYQNHNEPLSFFSTLTFHIGEADPEKGIDPQNSSSSGCNAGFGPFCAIALAAYLTIASRTKQNG